MVDTRRVPSVNPEPAPAVDPRQAALARLQNSEFKRIMDTELRQEIINIEKAVGKTKTENPNLQPEIFDDIIALKKKYHEERLDRVVARVSEINQVKLSSIKMDDETIKQETKTIDGDINARILGEVMLNHRARGGRDASTADEEVKKAWELLAKEGKNTGALDSAKQFASGAVESLYDEKKGGLQTGGVIGLVAGLIGGTMLTGGFGGGIMGIISTILIAVAGVWAGNKLMEPKDTHVAGNAPSPTPGLSKAQQAQRELERERAHAQARSATSPLPVSPAHVDNGTNPPPPPPSPKITTQQPTSAVDQSLGR